MLVHIFNVNVCKFLVVCEGISVVVGEKEILLLLVLHYEILFYPPSFYFLIFVFERVLKLQNLKKITYGP